MMGEFERGISFFGGGWGIYQQALAGAIAGQSIGDEEIDVGWQNRELAQRSALHGAWTKRVNAQLLEGDGKIAISDISED